ncbi:MAG: GumC family protein [Leptospirillum sp.]|jgi:tyrosine-protein kinase Etk/Wzc
MNTLDPKTILLLTLLSVRKHKLLAFATFLLIFIPFVAAGLMKKPIYVAKATVYLKPNNYSTSSLGNRIHPPRSFGIQIAILKSQYLAQKVVQALPDSTLRDLESDSQYTNYQMKFTNLVRKIMGKEPIVINPMQKAAMELRNARMDFKGGAGSILIIEGESGDPKVARDLVNAYIDTFKDISSHFALEQQADLDKSLSLQILNAQSLLTKSENTLLAFENRMREKGGKKGPVDVSDFLAQETGLLKSLRMRRSQLLLSETESHPDVIAVNQEIDGIKVEIAKLRKLMGPAGSEPSVSSSAWESFLESNVKMHRDLRAELEEERSSVRIISDSNLENMIIIDPPTIPMTPMMTKGFRVIIVGFVGGIAGAMGLPFLLMFFRKPIQGEDNLKILTGYQNLANIPKIPKRHIPEKNGRKLLRVDHPFEKEEFWVFQKEFESFFLRVKRLLKTNKGQVLLFTSCAPEDGKSLTVVNLALTMAAMGHRTIVLDTDTVRGRIQEDLKLPNSFSVEDFLPRNDGSYSRIVWDNTNLATISMGDAGPGFWKKNTEQVISKWFEMLRFQCDYILIDAPPLMASTDLLSLPAMIDGVLIVVRDNVTVEKDLLKVESLLRDHQFEVMGTVLNYSKSTHIQYAYGYEETSRKK